MKPLAPLALVALLAASAPAQTPQFTDPANLRGERVSPRDGRELPIDGGSGHAALGLQQMLRRLNTRASLLLIVAHPDDEDGGMLTYYSRGLGARVGVLTLNRGEGGQNAMTGDFEDALGLLRTQELLSADRYLGVSQMFGTEVDFGFSKTKEEALRKWTHERVLYDAVRAIRLFRPLVIASVFIGGVTDGHGQHQVAGQIAQEAFKAAGDPKVFPELTAEGILPWQAERVYARDPLGAITREGLFDYATGQYVRARFINYVNGEVSDSIPSTDVVIHEGATDPLLTREGADQTELASSYLYLSSSLANAHDPLSYVQFARLGLGLQRSQIGPGARLAPSGDYNVGYHLYGSRLCEASHPTVVVLSATNEPCLQPAAVTGSAAPDFFTGMQTSLESLPELDPSELPGGAVTHVGQLLQGAQSNFDPAHPAGIAPELALAAKELDQLIGSLPLLSGTSQARTNALHELRLKRVQLNEALVLALGLRFNADSSSADLTTLQTASATTHLSQTSSERIQYQGSTGENSIGEMVSKIGRDVQRSEEPQLAPGHAVDADCTWDPSLTSEPTRPYFFRTNIESPVYQLLLPSLRNAALTPNPLTCFVAVTYRDVRVEIGAVALHERQPVALVPAGRLSLSAHAQVLPNAADSAPVSTFFYPVTSPPVVPKLVVPADWKVVPAVDDHDAPGQVRLRVIAPVSHRNAFTLSASANGPDNEVITEGYRPVGYGDLPRTNYYTPATDRIVPVDLKLPAHRRIAYLPGTGDAVPDALASIGLTPTILTVADLNPGKLRSFDTVVLGVRTYNAHPDLHGAPTQALLDFARNGGNVVVQYQTAEFTGADAPFPLTLGSAEKVVDETAPVRLLDAAAPVLSTPNQLSEADFHGWVEERGHGFLGTWASEYTAPTETHDSGSEAEGVKPQGPQRGGLVTVPLGLGHWTYVAFALYRQLPEAVPGSFRLFANLLALADPPK